MPVSNDTWAGGVSPRAAVLAALLRRFPNQHAEILDVGAGAGAWRDLLAAYPNMDAVEVYAPYVARYRLRERYRRVVVADARALAPSGYDLIILGDVLEHLSATDGPVVVARLASACQELLVGVPYECPQGGVDGNDHEAHLQPDLTPAVMTARYPMLRRFAGNVGYGYYVKR